MTLHLRTALLPSWHLEATVGAHVWLKLENTQPSGSFKLRGIGALVESQVADGVRAIVSSSGGNAGLAAAWAARALGIECRVVVPTTTPVSARERLASLGATVDVHGAAWDAADAYARALCLDDDAVGYVPPFDHPTLWAGHGTLVDELATQLAAPPDRIVVAVGGGGLMLGVLDGLARNGWDGVSVVAVETHGAASLAAALAAGRLVTLPAIDSVAKSLGARTVAAAALTAAQTRPVVPVQVSDSEALAACRSLLAAHHMLVEPACGAALAALGHLDIAADERVVVVLCGGSVVTVDDLRG